MSEFAKAALNTWCGRKKLKINYEISDVSKYDENAPDFHCEVSFDVIFVVSAFKILFCRFQLTVSTLFLLQMAKTRRLRVTNQP